MRLVRALALALTLAERAVAQSPAPGTPPAQQAGQIRGRLVDAANGRALSGGLVTVRLDGDTASQRSTVPDGGGTFAIDGLRPGRYTLRARILGYTPLERADVTIAADRPTADVGALAMEAIVVRLSTQAVTAERPDATLAPDRNSYAVKNMLSASGGTAIDVLRNVPSVDVDATNRVSLNGNSNVVVQINGRKSPLTGEQLGRFLAQVPAGTILRVEVATNPSAKNEAEGAAGIINIVLDQDAGLGLGGGTTLTLGTSALGASGNVGRQAGPWTLFASANVNRDRREQSGSSSLTNFLAVTPAHQEAVLQAAAKQRGQGLTLRSEYKLADREALSFDAVLSGGRTDRRNSSAFTDFDASGRMMDLYDLFNTATSHYLLQDYALVHRHTGGATGGDLATEVRYTHYRRDDDNFLFFPAAADQDQRNTTAARMPTWTGQSDYTRHFTSRTKLEAGVKGTLRTTDNDFVATYSESAAERDVALRYREQIGAGYAVLSHAVAHVDAQLGLRLEQASTRLNLPTEPVQGRELQYAYGAAFPSAVLGYHFTDLRQLKLSYSRRVSRPSPVQLSPAVHQDQPRNVFQGNPALRPEYTDAIELGFQDARSWGTVQVTPFLRHTAHAVRYIRMADSTGTTFATFENVASTVYAGANVNLTYRRGPLGFVGGVNAYRFTSDAGNLKDVSNDLSVRSFSWSVRGTTTLSITPATDAQVVAHYLAPTALEGGSQTSYVILDFALRHKIGDGKMSITARASDPFSLMTFGVRTRNDQVSQATRQNFGVRGAFVSFNYNFGQQVKLRQRQEDDAVLMARPVGP